jgi:hypothetical protein
VKILVLTKKTLAAHRNTGVELYTSKEPQKEAFRTTKKEDDLMAVMNDENWNQAILFKSYKVFNDSVADDSESDSDDIECCRLDVLVCTKDIKDDVAVVVTGGNTTGVNRNRSSKNTIRDDETRVEVFLMGMAMSEENDDDTAVEKVYKIPGHRDAIHILSLPPPGGDKRIEWGDVYHGAKQIAAGDKRYLFSGTTQNMLGGGSTIMVQLDHANSEVTKLEPNSDELWKILRKRRDMNLKKKPNECQDTHAAFIRISFSKKMDDDSSYMPPAVELSQPPFGSQDSAAAFDPLNLCLYVVENNIQDDEDVFEF